MQQHHLQATSPLDEWLYYLENSHFKAIDLGLERIRSVATALDILKPASFVITVGGTNGKGTTCRLLETVLINAGYRVGVYSSPHLLRYNERVRIQNQELADIEHSRSFVFIERYRTESLTYFEFSTLSALHLFKQAELDIVILEVGLGGRLDATNIVDSDIAVITGIDIDHTDFLGNTREQIAFEKSGIFRTDKTAIIGEPDVPNSMLEYAAQIHCRISRRGVDWYFDLQDCSWCWQGKNRNGMDVRLENLPFGHIPLPNAATALAVIQHLPFTISRQQIRQSLQQAELTGRFQTVKPEQLKGMAQSIDKTLEHFPQVIIDVGHNPQAARYLSEKLTALKTKITGDVIAVCGILKDKDAKSILLPLLPVIGRWYCVTLEGYRGQRGEDLLAKLRQTAVENAVTVKADCVDSVLKGVKYALRDADERDVILVFGSFHTVGEFLQSL